MPPACVRNPFFSPSGYGMRFLLQISRGIDAMSERIGQVAMWLVLLTTLISAGNAIVRKTFNMSSNSLLEIQWYLYAAVFLLGGGYAFLRNEHVRIDFLSSRFGARTRNWVDIVGILVFLFPLCYLLIDFSWPLAARAWETNEVSANAGGLIRWPVYALIPLGFVLLAIQGVSELIKRCAFLAGSAPDPLHVSDPVSPDATPETEARSHDAGAAA